VSPYRWTILGAGTFASAAFAAVAIGLPALAPALRSHYHLSLGQIGVVLGATGLGMMLTLLPWGLAADRLGERAVMAIGLVGAAGALAATAWTGSYGALVGGLVVAGLLGASVNAASGRAVMGWFAPDERGLALGIRHTGVPIGGAAAAASLPWLAHGGGTKLAFLVLAGACAAGGVVAAALLRDRPPLPTAPAPVEVGPLRNPTVWTISLGTSLYLAAQTATMSFLVLFLHQYRGMSTGVAAAVLAVMHLLGAVARIAVGRFSDRLGSRLRPLRTLGLALAAGMAVAAALVDAPLAILLPAMLGAGVLGLSWNGLSFTAVAEAAPPSRSGAVLGLQQTVFAVAGAAMPIAFAGLVNAGSWRLAFLATAFGPLLGVAALRGLSDAPRLATRPSDARSRETSAIPPAAR
jgi:MFS family permease